MTRLPRFIQRLWRAYLGFNKHDGTLVAAGIAYYLALSFFPLLMVLVAGLGYALEWTARGQDAQQRILAAIEQQASADLSDQVRRLLNATGQRAPAGGVIGACMLVIAAIAIFAHLDYAFDRIWNFARPRHETWWTWIGRRLIRRLKSLIMLIAAGGFVLAVMVASIVWTGVQTAALRDVENYPWLPWVANIGITTTLNFIAFTFMYRFLPKAKVRWGEAIDGAIIAAAFWEAGRQLLALYLLRQNFPSAYGVIGSFIAIMLWAYYAMIVALFGAEFVHAIYQERVGDATEADDAPPYA